jgi:hypothetical protein
MHGPGGSELPRGYPTAFSGPAAAGRIASRCLSALAAFLVLVGSPSDNRASATVIDVSFLTSTNLVSGGTAFGRAQTFTAGINGELAGIMFPFLACGVTCTLTIRDVVDGHPGDALLGTPVSISGTYTNTLFDMPSGIFLTAGLQYAITFQFADGLFFAINANTNDAYGGGAVFDTRFNELGWVEHVGWDINFQTLMDPAEIEPPPPPILADDTSGIPQPTAVLFFAAAVAALFRHARAAPRSTPETR